MMQYRIYTKKKKTSNLVALSKLVPITEYRHVVCMELMYENEELKKNLEQAQNAQGKLADQMIAMVDKVQLESYII